MLTEIVAFLEGMRMKTLSSKICQVQLKQWSEKILCHIYNEGEFLIQKLEKEQQRNFPGAGLGDTKNKYKG